MRPSSVIPSVCLSVRLTAQWTRWLGRRRISESMNELMSELMNELMSGLMNELLSELMS